MRPAARVVLGLGAMAIVAATLLLRSDRGADTGGSGGPSQPTAAPSTPEHPAPPVESLSTAPVSPAAPPALSVAERGDAAMARALDMRHPERTVLQDSLARYAPDELQLRARIARQTREPPPAALDRLFELRGKNASIPDLKAFADRELAASPDLHSIVDEWISTLAVR